MLVDYELRVLVGLRVGDEIDSLIHLVVDVVRGGGGGGGGGGSCIRKRVERCVSRICINSINRVCQQGVSSKGVLPGCVRGCINSVNRVCYQGVSEVVLTGCVRGCVNRVCQRVY